MKAKGNGPSRSCKDTPDVFVDLEELGAAVGFPCNVQRDLAGQI